MTYGALTDGRQESAVKKEVGGFEQVSSSDIISSYWELLGQHFPAVATETPDATGSFWFSSNSWLNSAS